MPPSTPPDAIPLRRARAALAGARRALAPDRPVTHGVRADATLALRDLALTVDALPRGERAAARRLLARPTAALADPAGHGWGPRAAPRVHCAPAACVHWASNPASPDSPDLTDASGNGVPDQVDLVLSTVVSVRRRLRAAGYRAPLGDGRLGGNARTDVYLADIGGQGLYGYCATDAPAPVLGAQARAAYCVLDDDYDPAQFPVNTPLENLQVTVAHEYFHAVQFAYDATQDAWFMEATAAWIEDELFDDVDDNRQYLRRSPLRQPRRSLDDRGRPDRADALRVYGGWIFFRWLGERFPATQGAMPTVVRDIWATAGAAGPDVARHSLSAIDTVLRARGTALPAALAGFAADNLAPATSYDEGAGYPAARPVAVLGVGRRALTHRVRLDHLTSASVRLTPDPALRGRGWRLRLRLDLPQRVSAPAAVVSTLAADGTRTRRTVALDRTGAGRISLRFAGVRHVDVTLVNASTRLTCWRGSRFSCAGAPTDDARPFSLTARAVR